MCYSPDHTRTLAELDQSAFEQILELWADETDGLLARSDVEQVLIFENKGAVIGVSNPHPHCQIYAGSFEFKNLELERIAKADYFAERGTHLMADIIRTEQEAGARIVSENDHALAFMPYFSRFPYESYVVPKARHPWISGLSKPERAGFAAVLRQVLLRYDNMWRQSFPYMLVLHQAPVAGGDLFHSHIQIHPLMRQPTLQKFLAGVESGGGHFLNDVDPDGAAKQLREVADRHYLQS